MAWLRKIATGTDLGNVSEKAAEIQIRKTKCVCVFVFFFFLKDDHRFVVSEIKFRL